MKRTWWLFLLFLAVWGYAYAGGHARGSGFNEGVLEMSDYPIDFEESEDDPGIPVSDNIQLYAKDKAGTTTLYTQDSSGAVVDLITSGSLAGLESDPLSWSKASDQTLLTGDKSGSFDLTTTGVCRLGDAGGGEYALTSGSVGISFTGIGNGILDAGDLFLRDGNGTIWFGNSTALPATTPYWYIRHTLPNLSILSNNAAATTIELGDAIDITAANGNLTTTGLVSYGSADWTGGNVTFVPLTGDIATYVAAASAGDTLVLAAGNYAITAQINLTQAINIVGQGVGKTTITHTATEATDFTFYATASNVRIADLTITMNHSVGTTRSGAIRFDGTAGAIITGNMVTNCNITNTTTTAQVEGITFTDASGTVRDCNVTATTSGTNKAANALYFLTNATAEAASTSYVYNTHATSTGTGTSISSVAFYTLDNGSGYDCNVYLYNCNGSGTGASAMEAGIYANNDNAKMYAYNCIFKGDDYDAAQANSAVVQLSNCTLVNNTTNGTITYDGAIAGEGLTLLSGGDIRPSADSTTAINIAQADGTDFVTFDTTNKRVGIGTTAPEAPLHVSSATYPVAKFTRNTTASTTINGANLIERVSSNTATNGMGVGQFFSIENDAGVSTLAGLIGSRLTSVASGAETMQLSFNTRNAGGDPSGDSYVRMVIDGTGNVGIGTTAPTTTNGGLDISSGGIGLIVGADNVASTRTDSTIKYAKMGIPHYTNTEEPMNVFFAYSSSTENLITYGGGSSAFNAATKLSFNTAANNTTTTGTERMVITSAGNVGIGTTSPGAKLEVYDTQEYGLKLSSAVSDWRIVPLNSADRLDFIETGVNTRMTILNGGNVGIGTTAPSSTSCGLDIASGGLALVLGADSNSSTRTNSTIKYGRIGGYHYTNTEKPIGAVFTQGLAADNTVCIGGGSSLFNAATIVNFFTAANTTTTTGTERMRIASDGSVGIGITAPQFKVHVSAEGTTPTAALISGTSNALVNSASGVSTMAVMTASNTANIRGIYKAVRSRGTLSSPTTVAEDDTIMSFLGAAYDGTALQIPVTIDMYVDGAVSSGVVPARISFVTGTNASTRAERFVIKNDGNINLPIDSQLLQFGGGQDATISYDGTNMIINPKLVGTGYLNIKGQTLVDDKIMFTQTDGNEYIDSGSDGWVNIGATTGVEVNAPILNVTGIYSVNGFDCGDAGGFSGMKFNAGTTQLEVWIDGSKIGHFSTDGTYTDDVA
jgi:hypothetical protein